ncbi:MAG: dTDP-4-dehydrorhamnose 3,5-epimerase family protein [Agarilytica sp.]
MDITPLNIAGAYKLVFNKLEDSRGCFVKTFNRNLSQGIPELSSFSMEEEFYSSSTKGVLRGMHFQLPPFAHSKLVYCIDGRVFDAFVDLRRGSSSYLKAESIYLDSDNPTAIFLPQGVAHGFSTISDSATMVYKTDCGYSPSHDAGVLWSSCGIVWPCDSPLVSERDASFCSLNEFESPF